MIAPASAKATAGATQGDFIELRSAMAQTLVDYPFPEGLSEKSKFALIIGVHIESAAFFFNEVNGTDYDIEEFLLNYLNNYHYMKRYVFLK